MALKTPLSLLLQRSLSDMTLRSVKLYDGLHFARRSQVQQAAIERSRF
jgi:hypothetical protein